jgi:fluoride exporter
MTALLVALGAGAGASARFLLAEWLNGRAPVPYGTLAANTAAALLLGVLVRVCGEQAYALLGVGFCGALSTYSTLAWETHSLASIRVPHALNYQTLSIVLGIGAVALGWWVAGL